MSIDTPEPKTPPNPGESSNPPPHAEPNVKQEGGSIWRGIGIGCGSYVLILALFIITVVTAIAPNDYTVDYSAANTLLGPWGTITAFAIIPLVVGGLLMIRPKTRRIGIGVFIAIAAAWLIAIGPCLTMMYSA